MGGAGGLRAVVKVVQAGFVAFFGHGEGDKPVSGAAGGGGGSGGGGAGAAAGGPNSRVFTFAESLLIMVIRESTWICVVGGGGGGGQTFKVFTLDLMSAIQLSKIFMFLFACWWLLVMRVVKSAILSM